MSIIGIQPIQSIESLIESELYSFASTGIAQLTDSSRAEAIWKKLSHLFNTECWTAFLMNPHLNIHLTASDIKLILALTRRQYQGADASTTFELNEIVMLIAKNPRLCTMIGYDYLIPFVVHSATFASYSTEETYFKHLSDRQLVSLMKRLYAHPFSVFHVNSLLHSLQTILANDRTRCQWALNAIKGTFMQIQDEVILLSTGFTLISSALKAEFDLDADLALTVLKRPKLCQHWIQQGYHCAYRHPKFTTTHFLALSAHYSETNPELSTAYEEFALSEQLNQLYLKKPKHDMDPFDSPPTFLRAASLAAIPEEDEVMPEVLKSQAKPPKM